MVVVVFVLLLASIFMPLYRGHRSKPRQTTCTSQLRQLATCVQMYVQDHGSRYPGKDWHAAIETYAGSQKLFSCPSDDADGRISPISYGYSGLLVRADGTGCDEAQIKSPTEVGALADAAPTRAWADGGGLMGGGALGATPAVEFDPRHNGVIIGFCDGHAKFFPGGTADLRDISYQPGRALYQALGLGLMNNYGGGLPDIPCTPTANTIVIGGDFAGMPLVMAAAEVWSAKTGTWYSRGFKGTRVVPTEKQGAPARHFAWLDASDSGKGVPVARDALVIIVAKYGKLAVARTADAARADLVNLFGTACAPSTVQAYTYDAASGTRAYLAGTLRAWGAPAGKEIGAGALTVRDDLDMVERVAADPYGIGYCSAAMADQDKVTILALDGKRYPNQNPKTPWLLPADPAPVPGAFEYPLIRTLRVRASGDGTALVAIMTDPAFRQGPLFTTSYFRP